ncbi:DUF6817 domain-containing protein [Rhizobacter sp. P5_C2]
MTLNENGVVVSDSIVPHELLQDLQAYFERNIRWTFGSQSDRSEQQFGHWNYDFLDALPDSQADYTSQLFGSADGGVLKRLWDLLQRTVLPGHQLVRFYANAHTYGVEGYPHIDTRFNGNYSTIIYLNPTWSLEWAGETIVANEMDDVAYAVLPKPGRVLAFDGRLTHSARSVSRRCSALRVCLVIKTKVPGSHDAVVPPGCASFLKQTRTHEIHHSGRATLYDHLVGTYRLLTEFDVPEPTRLAGLFHSVYATQSFQHVSVLAQDRPAVLALIGEEAERLVRIFSTLPRPRLLDDALHNSSDRWEDVVWEAASRLPGLEDAQRADVMQIAAIECANLIDQKALQLYPRVAALAQAQGWLNERGMVTRRTHHLGKQKAST